MELVSVLIVDWLPFFVSGKILYFQSLFCFGNERNEEIQENQRIQGRALRGRIEVFWHSFPDAVSSLSCRAFEVSQ